MLRFFNRLLVTLILVGTALIITLTNSEPATIRVGNWFQISSFAGVIYLGVFSAGCIAASIVGLFFGVKAYFRERRLLATERNRQAFIGLIEKSRSLMAANEWGKAQAGWEGILRRDPENIVARVELSKCLEQLGDPREALRVLDATRAGSRRNIEVLFRAAELNRALGNNTAAMDNLALIAGEAPSKRSLEMARETSENLGRIDDALEYQEELERLGLEGANSKEVRARLTYAQILRDAPDATTLRETLLGFVKRHPSFTPALEKLASIELEALSFESAAELLVKVAKSAPGDLSKWRLVIDLWLNKWPGDTRKKAERAIAAARASTQDSKGANRIEAECLVVETLLSLNKVEDALQLLDELPTLLRREGLESDTRLSKLIIGLRGVCLTRLGRTKDTLELWESLVQSRAEGNIKSASIKLAANSSEPSPTLSTP
jgi:tetratricopeptide (TPR) repeat protein